jgi:hypothetical protein
MAAIKKVKREIVKPREKVTRPIDRGNGPKKKIELVAPRKKLTRPIDRSKGKGKLIAVKKGDGKKRKRSLLPTPNGFRRQVRTHSSRNGGKKPTILRFNGKTLGDFKKGITKAAGIIGNDLGFAIAKRFQFGKVPIVWKDSEDFNLLKNYGFLDESLTAIAYSSSITLLGHNLNQEARNFYDAFMAKNPNLMYKERVLLATTDRNSLPFMSSSMVSLPKLSGVASALNVLVDQEILGKEFRARPYVAGMIDVEESYPDDLRVGYAFGDIKSEVPNKAVLFVADVWDAKKLAPNLEHLRARHGLTHRLYSTFVNTE